uniref:DEUBAD domain-containing protein n=1 Tax=Salix viminalis TaxID=40686 RepID=A0A6N2L5G7_SALVM
MAIEKNNFKISNKFDAELSSDSRDTAMSIDEDEDEDDLLHHQRIGSDEDEEDAVHVEEDAVQVEEDDDEFDEFNDADSGAGSDDFDLLELGETRAEFCQFGNLTCSVPFELYDLPGLQDILSVDVWNDVLTEDDKFSLTKYLPDVDQDTFMRTVKELLEGGNFHFGSPINKLHQMLKGGLCEPRVALYRDGLYFFQKRQHYHLLRKHQNSMVSHLCQIRDAWHDCKGYSIGEKLRVLNIMKSHKSLMHENVEGELESGSSDKGGPGDGFWGRRVKDRKSASKFDRTSAYQAGSGLEFSSPVSLEVAKYGKQNPRGILKAARSKDPSTRDVPGRFPSVYHGLGMASVPHGSALTHSRQNKLAGYDSGDALRLRDQMRTEDDDAEYAMYIMGVQRDRNMALGGDMVKSRVPKSGKKHDFLRTDGLACDSFMDLPFSSNNDLLACGTSNDASQLSEAKVFTSNILNIRTKSESSKKTKNVENFPHFTVPDQMKYLKGQTLQLPLKSNRVDFSDHAEPIWHSKNQGQVFSMDSTFKSNGWNMRSKKWRTGRESSDLNFKVSLSPQVNDRIGLPEVRAKPSREKIRGSVIQNGRPEKRALKAKRIYIKGEETESDSSEQFDDEDDDCSNPLIRSKSACSISIVEGSRSSFLKSSVDAKKASFIKKDMQENELAFDGITHFSKKLGGVTEPGKMSGYLSKAKQKGKMHETHSSSARVLEDSSLIGLGKLKDDNDRNRTHRFGKGGQSCVESGERLRRSSSKAYPSDRKQKGEVSHDFIVDDEDDLLETQLLSDENALVRLRKKGRKMETYAHGQNDQAEALLLGCNSVMKKRKAKYEVTDMTGRNEDGNRHSNSVPQQIDNSISLKKKGKRKLEADDVIPNWETPEAPVTKTGAVDVELEAKPQKKPYKPITPTVHIGFSFSIIHLLSAVRLAMITPLSEGSLEVEKPSAELNRAHEGDNNGVLSNENADVNKSDPAEQVKVPSLTVQEIVNCVRSNPMDPCILETQEPLQDLIRGVLKIFSSKTAPLGIKGWKALVFYDKSTKSWSWIGPISHTLTDHDTIVEVTSPEYWGLSHKSCVKLVDSFANWLKSGQETLQQIGSLPAPPVSLMQFNLDEKERFRDLRAQKSLNTISLSSEEVRAYFRREEVLRYSIPDRAFSYTAADGKKSIVAPLRRCGGKPTSKARDHFMLKRDRPPHVTILCLVRDAAARLPGSIGTRADVCTLIRDSQYVVEDVSDAQVNQVVSGALDRLHYERDPCVQFDGERKLWVYLHRDREEEDFEDDGTSSTKKWKRQKKDPADQSDQGTVTVAFHETGDQCGVDLGSDLNAEPPAAADDDKRRDLVCSDVRECAEDTVDTTHGLQHGSTYQGESMVWAALSLNPSQENMLICQEDPANEDFDDETFERERPDGISTSHTSQKRSRS